MRKPAEGEDAETEEYRNQLFGKGELWREDELAYTTHEAWAAGHWVIPDICNTELSAAFKEFTAAALADDSGGSSSGSEEGEYSEDDESGLDSAPTKRRRRAVDGDEDGEYFAGEDESESELSDGDDDDGSEYAGSDDDFGGGSRAAGRGGGGKKMGGGGGGGRKRARKAEGAAGFVVNRFQHNYVQADDCDDYGAGTHGGASKAKQSESQRTVGAGLQRGVRIVWKLKTVNGKHVRNSSNGIGSYQAMCQRPMCRRANPKGAGKTWSTCCQTIEAAAQAFEAHGRDPFDLGRKDLMHWA